MLSLTIMYSYAFDVKIEPMVVVGKQHVLGICIYLYLTKESATILGNDWMTIG